MSGQFPVDMTRGVAAVWSQDMDTVSPPAVVLVSPISGSPRGPTSTGLGLFTFLNVFLPLTSLEEDTAVPIYQ